MSLSQLLTEQRNPATLGIDQLSTVEMLRLINQQDQQVANSVAAELDRIALALDAIVNAMKTGGRLFYIGAGTSGRLGVLDASECPPTFNVPRDLVQGIIAGGPAALASATEASEDDPRGGARDLEAHGFKAGDVLVGIAASGRTPYVLGAIEKARSLGAVTVGVSCSPNSELSKAVDYPIEPLPGPEVIAGSTRMRAGTATKLVLNMLSTGAMIRLGYVYQNLMVNVQPTNAKLADRSRRIIADAAGVSGERAAELLELSGQSVKLAIVMGKLGVDRETAQKKLDAADGKIGKAVNG
jgi:N-acetylmuramic acid 6-phosphate etherase